MSIPTGSTIENISRLKGLKGGRRKVGTDVDFLQDLDDAFDAKSVSGTAGDYSTTHENLPDLDMGGQLTPQSYDVRANTVMNKDQDAGAGKGMWEKLGRALAMRASIGKIGENPGEVTPETPPIETQQVDLEEGLPPVTASQQESGLPVQGLAPVSPQAPIEKPQLDMDALAKLATLAQSRQNPSQLEREPRKNDLNQPAPREAIEAAQQVLSQQGNQKQLDHEELDRAQENPWQVAVYGATDAFANQPELVSKLQQQGLDFTPETQQVTNQYEQVMSDIEKGNLEQAGYDEQAKRIQERILSNRATDMDKYYIGMALLMPLLVGAAFGKEAGIGALGGAAQGLSDVYGSREKNALANEELLSEVNKQRGVQQSQIDAARQAQLEQQQALGGGREYEKIDPSSGQSEAFKEIVPGFAVPIRNLQTKEEREYYRKKAGDLIGVKTFTNELNDLTQDIIEISSQLKDKDLLSKLWVGAVTGKYPGSLSKVTDEVEFDGRMINAGSILEEKLGFLANAYAQAKELGQLDRAAQSHIAKIMNNPTSTLASPKAVIDQMLEVRKLAQKGVVNTAKNIGFDEQALINEFGGVNRNLYGNLNTKEEEKMSKKLLKE